MSNQVSAIQAATAFFRTILDALAVGVQMSRMVEEDRMVAAATMEKVRRLAAR